MHEQWIAPACCSAKALQQLPRRDGSAIASAAAAAQLRSSRCRAAPAHCTSCPAPRVLRARHKCRQSRALCGMPGAERACNRLADKPCARAGSTEIMGRPRRRRSESTRRARERAAKVCGRVSCCGGGLRVLPFLLVCKRQFWNQFQWGAAPRPHARPLRLHSSGSVNSHLDRY